MITRRFSVLSLAISLLLWLPTWSAAQFAVSKDPKSVSTAGGAAGDALNQIVRQDVGQGFSGQSLNFLALQNARDRVPSVGQQTTRTPGPTPRLRSNTGGSAAAKPFNSFSPSPTVSPYLNLFREDFEGNSDLNYNTLVQPMLQQQTVNQQVQRQAIELERQLQSVAAQSDFNPAGSKDIYPTGHQTVFGYYGHYYPTAGRQRRRQ